MVKRCIALAILLFSNACIIHANNPPPSGGGGGGGYSNSGGGYAPYPAGSRVSVLWKGSWYSAVVRQTSGNQSLVHYDGYSSSWDEWVPPGRIRGGGGGGYTPAPASPPPSAYYSPGSRVQVLWKGSWYNAVVLKASGNSYYVHYDGYSNSWNEWVGPSRMR